MRVTKIIREYVEKTINAKLTYGEPTREYKEACERMNELQTEVNEKVMEYMQKLCEEATAQLPEGFIIKPHSNYPITSNSYNSPMHIAARKHECEISTKRASAIESILVELELGGTKSDLERMIAEAVNA